MYYASLCIRDIEYGQEEQYLLLRISTPMGAKQSCHWRETFALLPGNVYRGKHTLISPIHGIINREDLIQTIYRMTDDGHAA